MRKTSPTLQLDLTGRELSVISKARPVFPLAKHACQQLWLRRLISWFSGVFSVGSENKERLWATRGTFYLAPRLANAGIW